MLLGLRLIPLNSTPHPQAKSQAPSPRDFRPVVDEDPASASLPLSEVLKSLDFKVDGWRKFNEVIRSRLRHRQFEDLDVYLAEQRKKRERLSGGGSRLYRVYTVVGDPANGPDGEWLSHMRLLHEWIRLRPNSITPRLALATTWMSYAGEARGDGYADEVDPAQWEIFYERLTKAEAILREAHSLDEKCPQLYSLALNLANLAQWPEESYESLFEEAVSYDPLHERIYYQKAVHLLPRWGGREGEWLEFLADVSDRLGGDVGSTMYYYVFSEMFRVLKDVAPPETIQIAWPRLKKGYIDMDRIHSISWSEVNRQAFWAHIVGDQQTARTAFERMGPNWDESLWETREDFEQAKTWALLPSRTDQKFVLP